jgi:EAL domain-containing protein (putative c-di-GMP-specific phosphodiesterase class I)
MSTLQTMLQDVHTQLSSGSVASARRAIQDSLVALRAVLHMEVAFVSRFGDGRRWFEFVDTDGTFRPFEVGDSDALEDSYCARVVDGRIPSLIHDAADFPELKELPATTELPVGAHLSVPLLGPDLRPMGTLCCFSRHVDAELRQRDVELLTVFAGVLSRHLDFLLAHERGARQRTDRLTDVISSGGPAIALQPIVSIATGRTAGYEALARFPRLDDWGPEEWFRAGDESGLGDQLEGSAVAAALALVPGLPRTTSLSVNVSARALTSSQRIVDLFTGAHAERLVLELTEHAHVADYDHLVCALSRVREAGVRVAVDDAGSGYAGLDHILRLQPEVLKLDRALIQGVAHHAGRQAMCTAMVAFTRRMESQLVAEGVETAEDLEALADIGVPLAQGYLLGLPKVTRPFAEQRRDSPS